MLSQRFEHDFLERTYPNILTDVSTAFSEIVANAWDAGATRVDISLPDDISREIIVQDNGSGMTDAEFQSRWMVMAYNRVERQGRYVEYSIARNKVKRLAYGRNGVGRHAMFCFSDDYFIETCSNGTCNKYNISLVRDGTAAFSATPPIATPCEYSGTKLTCEATKRVPKVAELKRSLSSRFLFDPEFQIFINGELVECQRYVHAICEDEISIKENKATISIYEVSDGEKNIASTGVAFWVGKKLVGNPDWTINGVKIEDKRRKFALKHIVVVQVDFLVEDVQYDWAAFLDTGLVASTQEAVIEFIRKFRTGYYSGRTSEMRETIFRKNLGDIEGLSLSSRIELNAFLDAYLEEKPEVDTDELNGLIQVLIGVLKSEKGLALLSKIATMEEHEIETLDNLLSQWSVMDMKTVLDEIDGRLEVIKAIEDLCGKKSTDELHTLHPLVAQARWLFGIEYDTHYYTSNQTLSTVMKKFFSNGKKMDCEINWRKRPDLLMLPDFSIGVTCTEELDENEISRIDKILILELKRGGFEIKRSEMMQAAEYIDFIYNGNAINAKPKIKAFVIGDCINRTMSTYMKLEDYGEVYAYTYTQLVSSAQKRLFNLREKLQQRYREMNSDDILQKILGEATQLKMDM